MKLNFLLQLVFIALAAVLVFSFVSAAEDGQRRDACTASCALQPDYADNNRIAPDFELPTIDGGRFRLSSQRGKVVIVNFWTKTCGPCLQEMPELAELGQILASASDKILLVTVSTDENSNDVQQTLRSVLEGGKPTATGEFKAPFITLVDAENDVVRGKYGTRLYPETWFIDPDGIIRARFDGGRDWSDPLYIDLAKSLLRRNPCQASFPSKAESGVPEQCKDLPFASSR